MRPWRIMPLLLSFLGVLLLLRVTFHSQGDDQRPIRTQQELQQPRLFLFIFLASHENLALTRKLLRHYLTLGYQPELIHIDFHIQTEEEASAPHSLKLKGVLREHGVTAITERILGKFFDDVKMDWQRDSTRRMGVKRGDWVVQIDSDEFHEYPGPVMDLLVEAERHRVSAIVGHFVDRVESTGKLVEISEETDLERTFTQGCELATSIYEGLNKKVGPHLHPLETSNGGFHVLDRSLLWPGRPTWVFDGMRVHHFKWVPGIADDLANWKERAREKSLLASYLQAHNNTICLECKEHNCMDYQDFPPLPSIFDALESGKNRLFKVSEPGQSMDNWTEIYPNKEETIREIGRSGVSQVRGDPPRPKGGISRLIGAALAPFRD